MFRKITASSALVLFLTTVLVIALFVSPTANALDTHSIDLELDNNQYLSITDENQTSLDLVGDLTLNLWIKPESQVQNGNQYPLILKYDASGNNRSYAFLYGRPNSVDQFEFVVSENGVNARALVAPATPFTVGQWHMATAVFTAGQSMEFFVNGVSVGSETDSIPTEAFDGTASFLVGGDGIGQSLDGLIDDVRVWSRALTSQEVADLYADSANFNNGASLEGWWKLDSDLTDSAENGNTLTNHNGATFSTDTPFGEEGEINPVIIVPGILGSTQRHDTWLIDPILHTYDDLIATLDENGYTLGEDLFTFGYDWRNSNVTTAEQLKAKIDDVKDICSCAKVDLVAHSMGGLAARYYMQSDLYEDDVDQLIFLGTPHRGAPKAYLMWEGGEFVTPSVLDRLTSNFLRGDAKKAGFESIFAYLREHPVVAVSELLPDYSYLHEDEVLRAYPTGYPTNPFLEALNADIQTLLDSGSTLYSFVSDDHDTIVGINVSPAPEKAPLWEHGFPGNTGTPWVFDGLILGEGDQTVPIASASFVAENVTEIDSKHGALPEDASADIVAILRGEPATTVVDDWNIPDMKVLKFQMFSPADMLVTDPTGKKIGTEASVDVNEIHGAFYAGPEAERELITIPNPVPGIYTVEVRGTGSGEFTLESTYVSDTTEDSVTRSGTTSEGNTVVYEIDLDADAEALGIHASIASTLADLEYAYASGWLDNGAYHSMKAKLTTLQEPGGKNAKATRTLLENIEKDLHKRHGKSVNDEAYNLLLSDIRSLLEAL